jgi:hypothetical protein
MTMTKKYVAPFSFGDIRRITKHRTYTHAWAVFQNPDSTVPYSGFSSSYRNAEIQVQRCRSGLFTGPAEIVECVEVTK